METWSNLHGKLVEPGATASSLITLGRLTGWTPPSKPPASMLPRLVPSADPTQVAWYDWGASTHLTRPSAQLRRSTLRSTLAL